MRGASASVLICRPDGLDAGRMAVEMAAALVWAARESAAVCFLRPEPLIAEDLFALTPASDVARVEARGLRGWWWKRRFGLGESRRLRRGRLAGARAAFWIELYRELRRHAGDQRLPFALRTQLRAASQHAFARSERNRGQGTLPGLPRQLLREHVRVSLPPARLEEARAHAHTLGLSPGRPVVVLEVADDSGRFDEAIDALIGEGYQVVRIVGHGASARNDVVDLASQDGRLGLVALFALLRGRFFVCTSPVAQRIAYLVGTPTIRLDALDPIADYPVRGDGLYLLATAVDLGTGEALSGTEMLTERYLRNPGRFGHRRNTVAEILLAVQEMKDGLERGWRDTETQTRFRALVVDAGGKAGAVLPHVAADGPEDGFIGDGRLARAQADRWL